MPLAPPSRQMLVPLAAVLAFLVLMPLVGGRYATVLLTDIVLFALFAASLGLLMGTGGMTTFGHAAYFGAGAYAAAIAAKHGAPFPVALLIGMLFATLLAGLYGWFCVRLSGVALAMLSLAFAQITWAIAFQWDGVTGGSNGLVGVWPPQLLAHKTAYYAFAVALAVAAIMFIWRLNHSALGYGVRASRDSPLRAEALGLDVRALQWRTFVLSGAFAGLAGALYVFSKGSLSPDALSIPRSMDGLVMVLLGGVQTLTGPVVGAAVFTWLMAGFAGALIDALQWLLGPLVGVPAFAPLRAAVAHASHYWQAGLGTAIVLLTLVFPHGIAGSLRRRSAGEMP